MTPERRVDTRATGGARARTLWRQAVRELCWTFDLDDDAGDPSILKLMSVAFAAVAVRAGWQLNATLGIGMGFLAVCTALGYKGAKLFAAWKGIALEEKRADVRAVVDVTTRTITDRRAQGDQLYEPAP